MDLQAWLVQKSPKPLLIDVREAQEIDIAPFPAEVIHWPLSQFSGWINEVPERLVPSQSVVVICHSGIRSWNFAVWLIEQGCGCEVWNLEGGIDAWSVNVDSTVPRY